MLIIIIAFTLIYLRLTSYKIICFKCLNKMRIIFFLNLSLDKLVDILITAMHYRSGGQICKCSIYQPFVCLLYNISINARQTCEL